MATSSNTLGGLLDLEREMAGIATEAGNVLVVEAPLTYGVLRSRDKVKIQTGQTQQQVGTLYQAISKQLKVHTG